MKLISRKTSWPTSRRSPLFSSALVACVLTFTAVLAAMGHPGHALADHGAGHVISSPYHLILLGTAGAAFVLSARFIQQRLPRRLMQAGGLAALGAAMWLGFGV